tara:strand:- start:71880 stop:72065 length:186 start_codon:yes stop_codon:yes gene_type:complete
MDTDFLAMYPPELTQGAYKIIEKLNTEEDEQMRSKLFGQLALCLERLKMDLDNYDSTPTVP